MARKFFWFGGLLLLLACVSSISLPAHASTPPPTEKGLLITPLRQYLKGNAGTTVSSSLDVANLTDKPLAVTISVKQFSVADYTYDYQFEAPSNNWLHLDTTAITLQPNRTQTIHYTVQIPPKSTPGGHYYTIFASANLESQGVHNIIQAADLLYLTVNGKLSTVSHLQSSSIHWISFGSDIPFTLEPINTGNVYSLIYVSSQLHGLFVPPAKISQPHMLMPGKVRELKDSIPSPTLPGIYLAKYGYRTNANWIIQQSHLVVFIPPWFIAFVLAGLLVSGKLWQKKKHSNTDGTSADENVE